MNETETGLRKIVGYVIFYPDRHIVSIAVHTAYRRRGIGSRLVVEVLKRTKGTAIAGAPAGGSLIAGMWLYLGAELPVNGTYEVRLRATCEGGTGLEIFYDDITVITKA